MTTFVSIPSLYKKCEVSIQTGLNPILFEEDKRKYIPFTYGFHNGQFIAYDAGITLQEVFLEGPYGQ